MRVVARWIQRTLFAIGFLILGYCGAAWINSSLQQYRGSREFDRLLEYKPPTGVPSAASRSLPIPDGDLIGKVEIPRLHLSAVVFQGTGTAVLEHGVGHLDGSPLPGQGGNVVLAAHRDTFFRGLKDIQRGDLISVKTQFETRSYTVDSTEVVAPDQTSVLDATLSPTLTLITCYPFYYVGHAPKRFIVRARDMQAPATRPPEPVKISDEKPPEPKQKTARIAPSRREDVENLTYVFRASQSPF